MRQECEGEYWIGITSDFLGYRLPEGLIPSFWVGSLRPTVHSFVLSDRQVRTDDFGREAAPLVLEGRLRGINEADMREKFTEIQLWVRQFRWLQRGVDGWVTPLLEGSDVELLPDGNKSNIARLRLVFVQEKRVWYSPDGREVAR